MSIHIQSFLTVEQTMTNMVLRGWREAGGAEVVRDISLRSQSKDFSGARDRVRLLNFDSVEKQVLQLEMVGTAAILLGESFFSGGQLGPKGLGAETVRMDLVMTSAQALAQSLQFNGTRLMQQTVLALIDKAEAEATTVVKAADTAGSAGLGGSIARGAELAVETGTNLTTSRLVTLGALDRASALGIGTFQITEILDTDTCPVCFRMHGRIFTVGPALDGVVADLSVQNTTELATSSPFPKQSRAGITELTGMSEDALVDAGWNRPPFHPACRGTVVPVGTVPGGTVVPFAPLLAGIAIARQTRDAIPE